jgi:RNA polymerase sigma factor (sigma-70 family)
VHRDSRTGPGGGPISCSPPGGPAWACLLQDLCRELRLRRDDQGRQQAFGKAWDIVFFWLSRHLRFLAPIYEPIDRGDLQDIASQKTLDLLLKAECGDWDPSGRSPGEVGGYLRSVARHALVDHLRQRGRLVAADPPESAGLEGRAAAAGSWRAPGDPPDTEVRLAEFVAALQGCLGQLSRKKRLMFHLRVLDGLSSKEIAAHPEISLKVGNVDVQLRRIRQQVAGCMRERGHDLRDIPSGTYVQLWIALRGSPAR